MEWLRCSASPLHILVYQLTNRQTPAFILIFWYVGNCNFLQLFFLLCFPFLSGLVVENLESQDFNVRHFSQPPPNMLTLVNQNKFVSEDTITNSGMFDPNPIQEIGDPAPDIWVWGLEPGLGYLPHVRRRPRLFWNKIAFISHPDHLRTFWNKNGSWARTLLPPPRSKTTLPLLK